jgi:hypothetical protein
MNFVFPAYAEKQFPEKWKGFMEKDNGFNGFLLYNAKRKNTVFC